MRNFRPKRSHWEESYAALNVEYERLKVNYDAVVEAKIQQSEDIKYLTKELDEIKLAYAALSGAFDTLKRADDERLIGIEQEKALAEEEAEKEPYPEKDHPRLAETVEVTCGKARDTRLSQALIRNIPGIEARMVAGDVILHMHESGEGVHIFKWPLDIEMPNDETLDEWCNQIPYQKG
jgi:hypothetical protein